MTEPLTPDAVRALVARLQAVQLLCRHECITNEPALDAHHCVWCLMAVDVRKAARALTQLVDENAQLWFVRARGCSCICHDDLDRLQADLKKTEQALFAANCMLRDLGVNPTTLETP